MTISGLCAFPITPASVDGTVDTDALQRLLARPLAAGVDAIGVLGSTGSYPYLSRAERRRAVAAAVECAAGRVPVLAGIGALRTDEAVALARDASEAGAKAGLLAPVSYAPLRDDEVFEHFRTVAEAGLALCIYANPATTHFTFTPALIGRLSARPRITSLKHPAPAEAGPLLATLRAEVPPDFSVGFSVDWNAAGAMLAGGDAWYSVLAGIYPATAVRLLRAARARDEDEVRRLNGALEPVWRLFRTYSSYRVVHLAAAMSGIAHAEPPRPVLALSGPEAAEVERVLTGLDLD